MGSWGGAAWCSAFGVGLWSSALICYSQSPNSVTNSKVDEGYDLNLILKNNF